MANGLDGKITIVTGGGRSVGRGVALRFGAGGDALLDVVDLSTHAAVLAPVARTAERFGGIDVVIHNAASLETALVADGADDMLDPMLGLNAKCRFWLAKDTLPWLRRSSAGRILITSSPAGNRVSLRTLVPYGAARWLFLVSCGVRLSSSREIALR